MQRKKPKTTQDPYHKFTVSMPAELYAELIKFAALQHRPKSNALAQLVRERLAEYKTTNRPGKCPASGCGAGNVKDTLSA